MCRTSTWYEMFQTRAIQKVTLLRPRLKKTHEDRTYKETVSFGGLQMLSKPSPLRPLLSTSSRPEKTNTRSSSPPLQQVYQEQQTSIYWTGSGARKMVHSFGKVRGRNRWSRESSRKEYQ